MQSRNINILSTAPLKETFFPPIEGFIVDVIPFTRISFLNNEEREQTFLSLSEKKITALFTSKHAVEAMSMILQKNPDWKYYSISPATSRKLLEIIQPQNLVASAKDASSLADCILLNKETEVWFFCGDLHLDVLPSRLKKEGVVVHEEIVYRTTLAPVQVDKDYEGILFFSPSAAESYFSKNVPGKQTILFSIGETTASAIRKFSTNKIICAGEPSKDAVLQTMLKYFTEQRIRTNEPD